MIVQITSLNPAETNYLLYLTSFIILYIIYYYVYKKPEPLQKIYTGLSNEFN